MTRQCHSRTVPIATALLMIAWPLGAQTPRASSASPTVVPAFEALRGLKRVALDVQLVSDRRFPSVEDVERRLGEALETYGISRLPAGRYPKLRLRADGSGGPFTA